MGQKSTFVVIEIYVSELRWKYLQVLTNLSNIDMILETIVDLPETPQLRAKKAEIQQSIAFNKEQEADFEQKLSILAQKRSDIYPNLQVPAKLGRKDDVEHTFIQVLPPFNRGMKQASFRILGMH